MEDFPHNVLELPLETDFFSYWLTMRLDIPQTPSDLSPVSYTNNIATSVGNALASLAIPI